MKKCNVCGFDVADDAAKFCPSCGNSFGDAEASYVNDSNVQVENNQYWMPENDNSYTDATVVPGKKKSKKVLWICLPIIAVILVAAIIVSIIAFAGGGPVAEIFDATLNTIEAENFAFKVDIAGAKARGKINIDYDNKDLQLIFNLEDTSYDKNLIAIYDGYLIEYRYNEYDDYYGERYERARKYDISEYIEAAFDNYDKVKDTMTTGDVDFDEYFRILEDTFGVDSTELKENLEEHIDLEKFSDAIKELFKLLADEEWLEENLGFEDESRNGVTYYSFDADFDNLSRSAEDVFSDCLESSDAEEILDEVVEELEKMDEKNVVVKADFAIEDSYISEITMKIGYKGDYERATLKISDVGETEIDTAELDEYLSKCK